MVVEAPPRVACARVEKAVGLHRRGGRRGTCVRDRGGAGAGEVAARCTELSRGGGASRLAEVVGVQRSEIEVARAEVAEWAKP